MSGELSVAEALRFAVGLHQDGRVEAAAEVYARILALVPDHVDALHFRGVALHQLGRNQEALALLRRARELAPAHADLLNNLGNVLQRAGHLDEALAMYGEAIAARDDFADAHFNKGKALEKQDRLAEALVSYKRAMFLQPRHTDVYRRLGAALYAVGEVREATEVYERWAALEPDNPEAMHLLAACTGKNAPARASDAFVQRTFDRFAESFDQVLGKLEYRAPALVTAALAELVGPAAGTLDILDIGCGTGLCGPPLAAYARRLVGVDLSAEMIKKAAARGVYAELVVAELTAYLGQQPSCWDAIVSADTLVYLGELEAAFAGARAALRPGGHLVFTVEEAIDMAEGFRLNPHGRYSHTRVYLGRALTASGLEVLRMTAQPLRQEAQKPVPGLVVVAKRVA